DADKARRGLRQAKDIDFEFLRQSLCCSYSPRLRIESGAGSRVRFPQCPKMKFNYVHQFFDFFAALPDLPMISLRVKNLRSLCASAVKPFLWGTANRQTRRTYSSAVNDAFVIGFRQS